MPGGRPKKQAPRRRQRGTGGISLHKPSGLWRATLPSDGDEPPASTYHATREAAERWLDGELLRRSRPPPPVVSADVTLGDWLDRWFGMTAPSAGWTERTRRIYQDHLWQFSPAHDLALGAVTPSDLQAVVATLLTVGAARRPDSGSRQPLRPLSSAGVREAVGTIRRALERARDDGLIARNPAANLALPKTVRTRPVLWTAAQRRKLAAVIAGDELEALWRLLFEAGLRIGEALGLQWSAVDHERTLLVIRRIVFRGGRVQEWPKGRRWREVGLTASSWAALLRHRERQHRGAVWVFERTPGVRWSYDGVVYRLRKLTAAAGVDYHPTHAGRHTHATTMLLDGVPAADVAERLGHADPSITLRLYASPTDEGRARALASAANVLDGPPAPDEEPPE